jgi:hypothetical protein
MPADALSRTNIEIRGHNEPMTVRTAADPTVFASLLDPQTALMTTEAH